MQLQKRYVNTKNFFHYKVQSLHQIKQFCHIMTWPWVTIKQMVEILIFVFLVRATLQNTETFYRIELSSVVPEL